MADSWDDLTDLEQLECIYCEMHKDVYGVKARWYKAESVEQARRDLDRLGEELKAQQEADARSQEQAALAFETRVQDCINMGAKTREDALRWIHQAESTDGDDEYLCYKLGLKYGYFRKNG